MFTQVEPPHFDPRYSLQRTRTDPEERRLAASYQVGAKQQVIYRIGAAVMKQSTINHHKHEAVFQIILLAGLVRREHFLSKLNSTVLSASRPL